MRTDAPPLAVVAGGFVMSSWVDIDTPEGRSVVNVPVSAGRVVTRADQPVPDQADGIVLPIMHGGALLDPRRRGAQLGTDGHRIQVRTVVESLDGRRRWEMPMGRFLVTDIEASEGEVRVSGAGMLRLVQDHQAAASGGLPQRSPLAGEVLAILAEDGVQGWTDPRLPLVTLPGGFPWGTDRLARLRDMVEAWPARVRMDGRGVVRVLPPPDPSRPVLAWEDGAQGTAITAPPAFTRAGVTNHIVVVVKGVEGEDGTTGEDRVVEYAQRTGRYSVDRYGWVTERVESAAITSYAQGQAVAVERAARAGRRAHTVRVTAVPDWRCEPLDAVTVTVDGITATGIVEGVDLPLTVEDGEARYDVEVDA